jgi:hypothetical protein
MGSAPAWKPAADARGGDFVKASLFYTVGGRKWRGKFGETSVRVLSNNGEHHF